MLANALDKETISRGNKAPNEEIKPSTTAVSLELESLSAFADALWKKKSGLTFRTLAIC
jgi:hypothetical protein